METNTRMTAGESEGGGQTRSYVLYCSTSGQHAGEGQASRHTIPTARARAPGVRRVSPGGLPRGVRALLRCCRYKGRPCARKRWRSVYSPLNGRDNRLDRPGSRSKHPPRATTNGSACLGGRRQHPVHWATASYHPSSPGPIHNPLNAIADQHRAAIP
jgi:hypothetical protein